MCVYLYNHVFLVIFQSDERGYKAWLNSLSDLCQISKRAESHSKFMHIVSRKIVLCLVVLAMLPRECVLPSKCMSMPFYCKWAGSLYRHNDTILNPPPPSQHYLSLKLPVIRVNGTLDAVFKLVMNDVWINLTLLYHVIITWLSHDLLPCSYLFKTIREGKRRQWSTI